MVDALRRVHRIVDPSGFVVDVHPSAVSAILEVGNARTGVVAAADAPLRHAAAGVALAAAIQEGLFAIDRSCAFRFYTYAATPEELKDYVAAHWRNGSIDDDSLERTRQALRRDPGVRPRINEKVYITKLRVIASKG